jgi:hypothetical protein
MNIKCDDSCAFEIKIIELHLNKKKIKMKNVSNLLFKIETNATTGDNTITNKFSLMSGFLKRQSIERKNLKNLHEICILLYRVIQKYYHLLNLEQI